MSPSKAKAVAALVVLGVCLLGSGWGSRSAPATEPPAGKGRPADGPQPADDRQPILGEWEDEAGNRWLITRERITVGVLGAETNFGYRLDPTQSPSAIVLAAESPRGSPPTEGIYRLEGRELTLCVGRGAWKDRRPTEFQTATRSQCLQLHRVVPPPPASKAALGEWTATTRDTEAQIAAKLRTRVTLDLRNKPLREVIEVFREFSNLNIVLDEDALREAGLSIDQPVNLRVSQVPLQTGLRLILSSRGLDYTVTDNVLVVTTSQKARGKQVRKVYEVSDLVPEQDRADSLVKLIASSIAPQTWVEVGGAGTVDYYPPARCLIVNQTPDVHEQIQGLLESVRELTKSLKRK
jgi:uncharacterized protein (TIGR03067 family)